MTGNLFQGTHLPVANHIFNETYAFLEEEISEQFYCESFDEVLTQRLYKRLSYHFNEEEIYEHRDHIRKAFKSYFSLLNQKISLFFRGNDLILLKDLKKHIFKEHSQQFHEKSQLLVPLFGQLEEFKVKEGVYMIPKETLVSLGCDFENIEDEALKKELYRETIKVALSLDAKDMVFFMNEKLTIKKFLNPSQESGSDRRAYGLPPEELEKLKTMVFEQSIVTEIQHGIDLLLKTKLDFSLISNDFFRKNAIPLVQKMLYQAASLFMGEDSHLALKNAFVNYIFREHFVSIHLIFSQRLLELHALREKNAENFLRFYDGNIELIDGKQTQKPEIIDTKGQKWNAVSILPVAIQKIRYQKESEALHERLQKAQKKQEETKERLSFIEKEAKEIGAKKEALEVSMKETITKGKELQDRNYDLKRLRAQGKKDPLAEEEIVRLVAEIKLSTKEEERLRATLRDTNNALEAIRIKKNNLLAEIQSQERYIVDHLKKIDNLTQMYAPIMEKYELIVDAVAKTLMTKY